MELAVHDLDSGILGISLSGRMDIIGTQQIDLKFTALTSTRKAQIHCVHRYPYADHYCQGAEGAGRHHGPFQTERSGRTGSQGHRH
jgi:hypothetical protein